MNDNQIMVYVVLDKDNSVSWVLSPTHIKDNKFLGNFIGEYTKEDYYSSGDNFPNIGDVGYLYNGKSVKVTSVNKADSRTRQIQLLKGLTDYIKNICKDTKKQSYNNPLPDIDIYFLSKDILPFINHLTNKDKIEEMTVIELSIYILLQSPAANNYFKSAFYLN